MHIEINLTLTWDCRVGRDGGEASVGADFQIDVWVVCQIRIPVRASQRGRGDPAEGPGPGLRRQGLGRLWRAHLRTAPLRGLLRATLSPR